MKLKQFSAAALSLCMLGSTGAFAGIPAAADDPPAVQVSLGNVKAVPGEVVKVPVRLSGTKNADSIYVLGVSLVYDEALEPVKDWTSRKYSDDYFYCTGEKYSTPLLNAEKHYMSVQIGDAKTEMHDGDQLELYFIVPMGTKPGKYPLKIQEAAPGGDSFEYQMPVTAKDGCIEVLAEKELTARTVVGDTVNAVPGDQVTYKVQLLNNQDGYYNSAALKMSFDPVLQMRDPVSGKACCGGISGTYDYNKEDGVLAFIADGDPKTLYDESGDFLTVTFDIPAHTPMGCYPIFLDCALDSVQSDIIKPAVMLGYIRVSDMPDVILRAQTVDAAPGETIRYSVYVDGNMGYDLISASLSISVPLTVRKESGIPNGVYTESGPAALSTGNIATLTKDGKTIVFSDAGKLNDKEGMLFSVYLTIPADTPLGPIEMKLENPLAEKEDQKLKVAADAGVINVRNITKIPGDADCDGDVDPDDAKKLADWLNGEDADIPNWKNLDLDGDSKVTGKDLTLLLQMLAEQEKDPA